ncbi:MAG: RES domain-containing protein [Crocinitomicaceae bacterium]|nr:RES domain-containing protein [Crocinitomicaceae bacterium]
MQDFPTIKQTKEAIKNIHNTDFTRMSLADIKTFYYQNFGLFPIPTLFLDVDVLNELHVFRARPKKSVEDEYSIKPYYYPPDPVIMCTSPQRANWTGHSVFYCSLSPETAIAELKFHDIDEEFYISRWSFDTTKIRSKKIMVSPMYLGLEFKDGFWNNLIKTSGFEERIIKEEGKLKAKRFMFLIKEISKLFCSTNTKLYPFTAYVAHNIMYNTMDNTNTVHFPILIFPSIEAEFKGMNFAILPSFVDNFMSIDNLFHMTLKENTKEKISSTISKVRMSNN